MKMKHKKHFRTFVCLVAGVMMLTTAVYANYDNASGYSNYKNAVKQLILEEDNYSAEFGASLDVDGTLVGKTEGTIKNAGTDYSVYNNTMEAGSSENVNEYYTYKNGGINYNYYPESNKYHSYEGDANSKLIDLDDATAQKAVRFVELLADTFVGDLKNNFVMVSDEDGVRDYVVNISGSQVPEVVNAGISLMFTTYNNESNMAGSIMYEDYDATRSAYYTEKTGKTYVLPDYENFTDEEWKAEDEFFSELYARYDDVMTDKGYTGVLFVKTDGSYVYYDTYEEYCLNETVSPASSDNILTLLGDDPSIECVNCTIKLDEQGRLLENSYEAALSGMDSKGTVHTVIMNIEGSIFDYGNTIADVFDPTGKTLSD